VNTHQVSGKNKESGQVLVIVALFLIALIAILALVLDGGNIYLQRRRMQNAADAGALAGARTLALNGTVEEARAVAQEYTVQRNQADSCQITIDASGVTVVACTDAQMTFARVVGLNQVTVCAQAAAKFGPVGAATGLAPIAVRNFDYLYGPTYTLWYDKNDPDPCPPGDTTCIAGERRSWINLGCTCDGLPCGCGGPNASELKTWMETGYDGTTWVNRWMGGTGGVVDSALHAAKARIGDVLLMPIYNQVSGDYYHIRKIAAFRVTDVKDTGNPKYIKGHFECYFLAAPPTGIEDGGVRTIALTE